MIYPTSMDGTISYNATNDPDSKTPHAIYELAIPMGTFEKSPAVRMSVWDAGREVNMHWPRYQGQGSWNQANFGDLVFSEIVVPEFPFGPIMILASVVLATAVVARRKTALTKTFNNSVSTTGNVLYLSLGMSRLEWFRWPPGHRRR